MNYKKDRKRNYKKHPIDKNIVYKNHPMFKNSDIFIKHPIFIKNILSL